MSHTPPPSSRFFMLLQRRPAPALSLIACFLAITVVAFVQLAPLGKWQVGLAYTLPLYICLWTRQRTLLYLMAVTGSALSYYKTVYLVGTSAAPPLLTWTFQLINLWIAVLVLHITIYAFERLDLKRRLLTETNDDLENANRELVTREEQVIAQNQELQSQAEELERQAEELRQQAEELEQQTVELHAANDELTRRERGLQTLLESARWLRSDLSERDVMSAVCQAAVQVMEEGVSAAAVVQEENGILALRGHYGFGVHGTLREELPFHATFASLVMERGQTAYVADASSRPDLKIAQPAPGRQFRSVLSTPLTIEGRIIGVVEVYAQQPREWTDGEFKVIEWLAAQCALAVQAIEYQQEVVVKRREAEEASIQKTRFLAAVSHDVRTPANAISLMADLIEHAAGGGGSGISEIPAMARDLKSNARTLVELVSDVLDLSRLDAGKRDLQISEFPLRPFLETSIRQFDHVAAEKKLRLTLQMPAVHPVLLTDKMKLARILANLLGNAIKFTEAGAIEVRCERPPAGPHAREGWQISVSDTGVGIPSDALPRIFDEFYQLQNPERDRNKGSGLGLAICKRLIDALGSTLSVESIPGVGTTFTILLPRDLVAPDRPAAPAGELSTPSRVPPHAADDGQLQNTRILLVEDHDVTRRAVSRLLASRGAIVLEARTGREALHLLVHDRPDVLLLDLMLPDADGTDILKHLRLHRPCSLKCVLAVSGDVREARLAEVKELGADDLLAKPLDIHKLMEAIVSRLNTGGNP